MARKNRVSAIITEAISSDVITNIKKCNELLPFLLNLSADERKKSRKMGPKSVDYVQDCHTGAIQFSNALAKDFPLDEFSKDAGLVRQLYPILVAAQALTEGLNDTIMALGTDCMEEADEVYSALKMAAKKDSNAKTMVEQISKRFKGQGPGKKVTGPK